MANHYKTRNLITTASPTRGMLAALVVVRQQLTHLGSERLCRLADELGRLRGEGVTLEDVERAMFERGAELGRMESSAVKTAGWRRR